MSNNSTLILKYNGTYTIKVTVDGYYTVTKKVNVSCIQAICPSCSRVLQVPLTPISDGEVVLVMGWRDDPLDLDIHVIAWNDERHTSCHVYWYHKDCTTHSLDVDNIDGGQAGFETVTFHDVNNHRNKTYLVYIKDYSNEPTQFSSSEAIIDIYDGIGNVRFNLQPSREVKRHLIAGCLVVLGSQEDGSQTFTWTEKREYIADNPDIGLCTGYNEDLSRTFMGNRRMIERNKMVRPVNKKTSNP